MVEQVISKILMEMLDKDVGELKAVLYCVLSGYNISEKSTEVQRIDKNWVIVNRLPFLILLVIVGKTYRFR